MPYYHFSSMQVFQWRLTYLGATFGTHDGQLPIRGFKPACKWRPPFWWFTWLIKTDDETNTIYVAPPHIRSPLIVSLWHPLAVSTSEMSLGYTHLIGWVYTRVQDQTKVRKPNLYVDREQNFRPKKLKIGSGPLKHIIIKPLFCNIVFSCQNLAVPTHPKNLLKIKKRPLVC